MVPWQTKQREGEFRQTKPRSFETKEYLHIALEHPNVSKSKTRSHDIAHNMHITSQISNKFKSPQRLTCISHKKKLPPAIHRCVWNVELQITKDKAFYLRYFTLDQFTFIGNLSGRYSQGLKTDGRYVSCAPAHVYEMNVQCNKQKQCWTSILFRRLHICNKKIKPRHVQMLGILHQLEPTSQKLVITHHSQGTHPLNRALTSF